MERRDRSLEALNNLIYIDSLDDELRASGIETWVNKYLSDSFIEDLILESDELAIFLELFYKNINFLKEYTESIRLSLNHNKDIKKFFQ
ncbi:MAG: hypothetical protein KAJ49_06210 [Arcobacteraceae bacterium]|nr:hypothetical protein [Arcobacteraceae bacterium]